MIIHVGDLLENAQFTAQTLFLSLASFSCRLVCERIADLSSRLYLVLFSSSSPLANFSSKIGA